ncbi:ribosome maturation factor RimM [Lutibaculum baratangense]|uniref:Ribosome maturation factor RimM n=1 Tax=Lutibaculum baratangense AMV1 TaxID=631454 RepID=V4TKH1_9HYPH|nr:ribosome maturation factor RimM [Lutibaculum baratangense]ESR26358.1 16S rRNA processing protein RimM [Lutibaculum baratangense AMV1]
MADDGKRVCVARIGAPHGVRGAVRLFAFTADPADVAAYGPLETEDGRRRLTIRSLKPGKDVLIAEFTGVADREAADALKNVRLYVDRTSLPEPEAEDEWYHADLIGLSVSNGAGETVGEVIAVQDFGGGDLLEIRWDGRRQTVYLPFTRDAVPVVDVKGGFLIVDPPAGLLDEGGTEDREEAP